MLYNIQVEIDKAIADENFELLLVLLEELERQVKKQALKRGLAMFSPSLVDEDVRHAPN